MVWVHCGEPCLYAEFPFPSWLAKPLEAALKGIGKVVADMQASVQKSSLIAMAH